MYWTGTREKNSMFLRMQGRIVEAVDTFLQTRFGIAADRLAAEFPPSPDMGDLALPVCFDLARRLKRAPRQIAQEIVEGLGRIEGVDRIEVAGAGYINVFFDRPAFLLKCLREAVSPTPAEPAPGKVIVEHTNINPNKAAHIGHLRNAVLGDTFVRVLRFCGRDVEVQNYIDNTGVQVADVVLGLMELRGLSTADLDAIEERFDYYCWDLYAEMQEAYAADAALLEKRGEILQQIEEGEGEVAELAEAIATRIVHCHIATMARLGVRYDVLPWEGDVLQNKFWERAFEMLKEMGAIALAETGRNAGCWVMDLGEEGDTSAATSGGEEGEGEDEKVIVRSNGTATYVAKDIAYQLWKLGLLGADFRFRPFHTYSDGKVLWSSSSGPGDSGAPAFGRGETVFNVIDVRQSYLQEIVRLAVRELGHGEAADRSIHFAYEMVALSPACARELGFALSDEEASRPHVDVSGRRGRGVKADDLMDKLEGNALEEVTKRNPDLDDAVRRRIASIIARASLRYFMIKYTRNKVIAFDFDEALNFEGESGPYLQYSTVRADNIFRKLSAKEPFDPGRALNALEERMAPDRESGDEAAELRSFLSPEDPEGRDLWKLLVLSSRVGEAAAEVARAHEPALLAKFSLQLAQHFNAFYHKYPVLHEKDRGRREIRAAAIHIFREQLGRALDLMAIDVPQRM